MTRSEKQAYDIFQSLKIPVNLQCIINYYICDFVGIDSPFILEVDGGVHYIREEYDDKRSKKLTEWGFTIFRVDNSKVSREEIRSRVMQVDKIGRLEVNKLIEKVQVLW